MSVCSWDGVVASACSEAPTSSLPAAAPSTPSGSSATPDQLPAPGVGTSRASSQSSICSPTLDLPHPTPVALPGRRVPEHTFKTQATPDWPHPASATPSRAAVTGATSSRRQEPAGFADPERSKRVDGDRGSQSPSVCRPSAARLANTPALAVSLPSLLAPAPRTAAPAPSLAGAPGALA
jgi:hypothetical protein